MPLWHLYCPEGRYSPQDMRGLADRITDLYAEYGLPRFLVGVVFQEVPKDSNLIGGEPAVPALTKLKNRWFAGLYFDSGRQDLNLRPPGPQPGALDG
jgi:phenylpyruvate tautomerase PptA (4-oxalocrotonate tautomerase family)